MSLIGLNPNSLLRPISQRRPILLHELAHNWHSQIDDEFSNQWSNLIYGCDLKKLKKKKVFRTCGKPIKFGYLSDYSFRSCFPEIFGTQIQHSTRTPNSEFELKGEFEHIEGISVLYIPDEIPKIEDLLGSISYQLEQFPYHLTQGLDLIVIDSRISYGGWFQNDRKLDDTKLRLIIEDVAESTAYFFAASQFPDNYKGILSKLKRNKRTKGRLELLIEFGFLDEEVGNKLNQF